MIFRTGLLGLLMTVVASVSWAQPLAFVDTHAHLDNPLPRNPAAAIEGALRMMDRLNVRTTLLITVGDVPGALLNALNPLSRHGVNVRRLEARPTGEPWSYRFFVEFDHASGEADIGVQQVTELLPIAGIDFIGPLPSELQTEIVYATVRPMNARETAAADALVKFLTSETVAPHLRKMGLEPG